MFKFEDWKAKFGKSYATQADEQTAFGNFQASLARVSHRQGLENGAKAGLKNTESTFGLTKFSDLTQAEFKAKYLTRKPHPDAASFPVAPRQAIKKPNSVPATFDWRDKGAVSPVKDQGQCGSCWAFSTTESVESQWFLKSGTLPILAPQQIVDCDTVDQGCGGGDLPTAFSYVTTAGGLDSEESYPYTSGDSGSAGTCAFEKTTIEAQINNFTYGIPPCFDTCNKQNSEEVALQAAVYNHGPMAICVDADPWQDYSGGVLSSGCAHGYTDLDHCVQLVGYNFQASQKYWIVRNSWNTDWGIDGYIYIAEGKNVCGIADEVAFANAL
jgi:cathepsin F